MSRLVINAAWMVSLAVSAVAQPYCQTPPCVCFAVVDSYQGTTPGAPSVAAFFNGAGPGGAPADSCQVPAVQLPGQTIAPVDVPGQTTAPYRLGQDGAQYRSVEFVRRFYRDAKGIDTSKWQGQYGDPLQFFWNPGFFGLESYPNGGVAVPAPDDIIGFGAVPGLSNEGHLAIVKSVDTSACATSGTFTVSLIEQNTSQPHQLTGSCPAESGTYTISSRCAACLPVQGWIRLPVSTYVNYSFTGLVISVSDPNGLLNGSIAGGSVLSGEFSFDTSAIGVSSGGTAVYQFNSGPVWLSVRVPTSAGPVILATAPTVVPASAPYLMGVQITDSGPDVFNEIGFASPATWPLPLSGSAPYINIELIDSQLNPTLFTSNALPTSINFQQTDDYTNPISLGNSYFGAGPDPVTGQSYLVQFKLTGLKRN